MSSSSKRKQEYEERQRQYKKKREESKQELQEEREYVPPPNTMGPGFSNRKIDDMAALSMGATDKYSFRVNEIEYIMFKRIYCLCVGLSHATGHRCKEFDTKSAAFRRQSRLYSAMINLAQPVATMITVAAMRIHRSPISGFMFSGRDFDEITTLRLDNGGHDPSNLGTALIHNVLLLCIQWLLCPRDALMHNIMHVAEMIPGPLLKDEYLAAHVRPFVKVLVKPGDISWNKHQWLLEWWGKPNDVNAKAWFNNVKTDADKKVLTKHLRRVLGITKRHLAANWAYHDDAYKREGKPTTASWTMHFPDYALCQWYKKKENRKSKARVTYMDRVRGHTRPLTIMARPPKPSNKEIKEAKLNRTFIEYPPPKPEVGFVVPQETLDAYKRNLEDPKLYRSYNPSQIFNTTMPLGTTRPYWYYKSDEFYLNVDAPGIDSECIVRDDILTSYDHRKEGHFTLDNYYEKAKPPLCNAADFSVNDYARECVNIDAPLKSIFKSNDWHDRAYCFSAGFFKRECQLVKWRIQDKDL